MAALRRIMQPALSGLHLQEVAREKEKQYFYRTADRASYGYLRLLGKCRAEAGQKKLCRTGYV